jgi:hypothetical protein
METRAFAPLSTATTVNPLTGAAIAGTLLASVTVTSTNASATASAQLPGPPNSGVAQIQIANTTTAWAYVNFGVLGAVTAATVAASYPVAPGSVVAPGTNTAVIFTRGEGL